MNTSPLYRIAAAATAAERAAIEFPFDSTARALADIVASLSEIAAAARPESLPDIERAARALAAAAIEEATR